MKVAFGTTFRLKPLILTSFIVQCLLYSRVAECAKRNFEDDINTILKPAQKLFLPIGKALVFNEALSAECTTALLRTGRALQSGKMWATRMLISNGLIPDNVFLGQTQAHGSMEQCIWPPQFPDDEESDDPKAQYCKVKLAFNANSTFYRSLSSEIHKMSGINSQEVPTTIKGIYTGLFASFCLPRDCSKDDVQVALDTIGQLYDIEAEVSSCQNGDRAPVAIHQIIVICVFLCILLLSLAGTAVEMTDFLFRKSFPGKFLCCFAVSKNWTSLLEAGDPQSRTSFLNGLKLLLCLWISAGHLIIFPSPEFTRNPGEFYNVVSRSLWFQLFSNINLAVVGFFFISGYLVHLGTRRFSTKRPVKYVLVCFARRYVKLVIPALIVLVTTFLYPMLSRTASPREGFYFNNIGSCSKEWYLLPCLSNNYIDIFREQCLTHLWYISTDLKIYPLVVALSIFYRRRPRLALVTCLLIIGLTSVFVGTETHRKGASGVVARADLEGKRYTAAGKALDLYTRPYTQVAAYVMGMLCAVVVEALKDRPPKFTTFAKSLFWILTGALFVSQTFVTTYSSIQVFSPAGVGMSIYAGISRPLHALIYLWLLTSCSLFSAEPLRRFLSHPTMFALGKLSYGVYLVHFPLGSLGYGNLKNTSLQYDFVSLSQAIFGTLVQSFVLATILYLFVEKPLTNIDKLFVNRRKTSPTNSGRSGGAVVGGSSSLSTVVSKSAPLYGTSTTSEPVAVTTTTTTTTTTGTTTGTATTAAVTPVSSKL